MSDIPREIADAGVGVGRLIVYDPRWPEGFRPTTAGFVRSFLGPLIGLPFYLLVNVMMDMAEHQPNLNRWLWAAALSHLVNAIGFPILVAFAARPLKIGAGYAGFIIILNWASLFLDAAGGGFSLLSLAGDVGSGLFQAIYLMLFGVSLFVTWRASRETLSPDLSIALLMVVMSVGVATLADQASRVMFSLPPIG